MIDYVLKGYEDTITQNKTQKLCHNACKDWSWCESSNYNMASGQCQLLNGSHYGDSRSLVSSKAWVYSYTCSKDAVETTTRQQYPCQDKDNEYDDYPILLTALKYPSANLTQARERCAQCNMQLCSLAQLKAAYDAGYRNDKWGLVNIQGRDAMVTSCGNRYYASLTECFFRIEGNMASSVIPHTPRPYENAQAFCCRACNMYTDFPIVQTPKAYPSTDLSLASELCALCGMKLCSLAQLKAAYDAGYRNDQWGLIDTIGQLAKVASCEGLAPDTCYSVVKGGVGTSRIPFTEAYSAGLSQSYCCPVCTLYKDYPIFFTPEEYPSADLTQARERCAQCDMQLCSLAQLKAAYDAGYRSDEWGLIDIQGREGRVTSCDDYFDVPGECYFTEGGQGNSTIPNTPRMAAYMIGYCCVR
ncbi:uncharacterized protein LOC117293264 [Asterias rubens]|uniref:uncharacterized protein LOC117293264 n=1 Tax=Asterias rubens TaxID=7604 RepID=UPI00145593E4|nr:uncharacterized protein LOC117293264 [Asterias rubens]